MKYLIGISLLILIALSVYIIGPKNKEVAPGSTHEVVVTEVLQANNYTYLHVKEKRNTEWLAVPSMIASVGDTYYYTGGMVMENFESKDLGRVFDAILFLEQVYQSPPTPNAASTPSSTEHTGAVQDPKMNFEIDPLEDGISIADLYSNKEKYKGKIVKVRGAVTKFNPDIMSLNWIHIQDGTHFEEKYDLTITTDQAAETGTVVIVEGKVILDKDFGYGYFYEVLMEDAKVTIESSH